jgi:hypothetical protein
VDPNRSPVETTKALTVNNTTTSVLARRLRIDSDYTTPPYEAGWATEAIFFLQVEGPHPELNITAEVSPDGIAWVRLGAEERLPVAESIVPLPLQTFGNWIRLRVTGASSDDPARILVHVNLKG